MPRSIFFSPRRCWCLRFHKASLLSPSSSPCPELCWGSVSWGWRVLSGSGRWEIPSMRSSTPSRISLAQSWKEQTHPRAAQQNPSCGNSPAKQLTSPDRWICKVGLSTQQSGLKLHCSCDKDRSSSTFQHPQLCHLNSLAKSPAHLKSYLIDRASLRNRELPLVKTKTDITSIPWINLLKHVQFFRSNLIVVHFLHLIFTLQKDLETQVHTWGPTVPGLYQNETIKPWIWNSAQETGKMKGRERITVWCSKLQHWSPATCHHVHSLIQTKTRTKEWEPVEEK